MKLPRTAFTRSSSLARPSARSAMIAGAGRGLVPEPVAELPARRRGRSGGPGFQVIGLQIVDRETKQEDGREPLARAGRRLAT
jgi:hypothetical protein